MANEQVQLGAPVAAATTGAVTTTQTLLSDDIRQIAIIGVGAAGTGSSTFTVEIAADDTIDGYTTAGTRLAAGTSYANTARTLGQGATVTVWLDPADLVRRVRINFATNTLSGTATFYAVYNHQYEI